RVARGRRHAAPRLDQHGDAPRGPETRVEAGRLGTALESLLDAPELDGAELRLAPRAARLLQASAAGYHQLPRPAIHRLPMDTDLPEIGRASCRESVWVSGVCVPLERRGSRRER